MSASLTSKAPVTPTAVMRSGNRAKNCSRNRVLAGTADEGERRVALVERASQSANRDVLRAIQDVGRLLGGPRAARSTNKVLATRPWARWCVPAYVREGAGGGV